MLLAGKSLGMEVASGRLSFAVVSGGKMPRLEAGLTLSLAPGALQLSRREPGVTDPQAFVAQVKEGHQRLQTRERSVSLSLPDALGRVMLLDLEARFRNREEGMEIIRWKLKKSLPFDVSTVHLDYQTLAERENGAVSLLVSLVSRPVVTQYEELLMEAGLEPTIIDFTSFNLYRLFAPRLEISENGAFVSYYAGAMTVMIFYGGVLSFHRSKETAGDAQNLYREVNSSFLVYGDRQPVSEVFCMAAADEAEPFRALVAEASGMEPILLDPERMVSRDPKLGLNTAALHTLAGCMGAALRNL